MAFFDTDDITAVMPFTLWMLKILGVRGSRSDFRRYQFVVFWICFVTVGPKTFLGYRDDVDLIIRGVAEWILESIIVIKVVIIGWNRNEFEQMLVLMRTWFKKTFASSYISDEATLLAECNRAIDLFAKGYFTYCMIMVSLFNAGPMIQSTLLYLNYDQNNSSRPEFKTHMEQEFYWLDIRTNFVHYTIYSVCAMVSYLLSSYLCAVEAVYVYSCCKCCSHMFDVIAIRLKSMASTKSTDQLSGELADIIKMHVDTFRCVQHLNDICLFAFAIQIFSCVLIWCSMAAYLTRNVDANAVNIVVLFVVITAETCGLCFLGTQLAYKSINVQNSVYDYPWYDAPIAIRRSLLRMLQRAQKRTGITAAGFCFVDFERFGSLVQTSYSIFIVLKDTL
ncbi:uncharacterized protein LOC134209944 [Armigeres subalbatus]|uniref:uncharacterized protein LOC134209944 n=1 Tax=Armigeres subalbatus TaxID=124917 RepID=UPI002ED5BCBE